MNKSIKFEEIKQNKSNEKMWQKSQQVLPVSLKCFELKSRVQKSVSFSSKNAMYEIEYIPEDLIEQIWYSDMEISIINSQNMDVAVEMSLGILSEDDKFTSRGLEHLGRDNKRRRQYIMTKAAMAVLGEQQRQKELGINRPKLLAASYRTNGAKKCRNIALTIGLQDKDIAFSFLKIERNKTKSMLKITQKNLKSIAQTLAGKRLNKRKASLKTKKY